MWQGYFGDISPKLIFFKGFCTLGGQSTNLGNLEGPSGENAIVWEAKLYFFLYFNISPKFKVKACGIYSLNFFLFFGKEIEAAEDGGVKKW